MLNVSFCVIRNHYLTSRGQKGTPLQQLRAFSLLCASACAMYNTKNTSTWIIMTYIETTGVYFLGGIKALESTGQRNLFFNSSG